MKKQIALALSALLVVGSIAGCSSSGSSSDTASTTATVTEAVETEEVSDASSSKAESSDSSSSSAGDVSLTVYWWGNQVRNERTQEALDIYAEENNVSIDGQFANWDDYWTKLATLAAGGSMPDILQMDYTLIDQYAKSGLLLDLTPYIEDGTIDVSQIDDTIIQSGTVDGGVYGISCGSISHAFMYNKTLTDSLGIEIPDYMTMDDFYDYCRQIYEATGVKTNISFGTVDNWSEYFMRAYDVDAFGDSCMTGDETTWIPFFDMYETGMSEGWMLDPGVFAEISIGSVEQDPMVYGQTPSTQSWCAFSNSNQLTAMRNAAPEGMEIGMTTWPSPDPKKSGYMSCFFFSVGTGIENEEEAAKLLNWLTNSYDANDILLGERGVPAPADVADHIADELSDDDKEIIDFVNNVAIPMSSPINAAPPDGSSEVYNLLNNEVEKVCYETISAVDAAAEFWTEANAIMEEH